MAKTRMEDLVVILPGITGSVLQKDGKDIWAISGQAAWQTISTYGESLQYLKVEQDDPDAEYLDDGIRPDRLVADASIVPGLAKIDGYTTLSRLIADNFQVEPGHIRDDKPANFFEFPYDWRRDNRATAKRLKRFLDERLKRWRDYTGLKEAKVILLAHSMGGLVSRYYLEVLEGWRDCKALFTFGTPHRGSANAVNFVANGYKKLFFDLTEAMRSMNSVYQLMPIYEMLDVGGEYRRIAETDGLPNIVKAKAEKALEFHREIESAVKRHQNDADYLKSYKIVPMVGTQQPTMQSAKLVDGELTVSRELPPSIDPLLGDGDGTVPYISAIPIELSNEYRETYIAERHGSIQSHARVLQELLDRLKAMQMKGMAEIRGPEVSPRGATRAAISLSLDDLYLADEPVEMRARLLHTGDNLGGLKARIAPVSGGETVEVDFQESGDEWVLTLEDLAPGLYRTTVGTAGGTQSPSPVRDLFEVVG